MRKIRSFLVMILFAIITFFVFSPESLAKERASSGGIEETTSIHLMKVNEEWVALSGATLQVFDVTDPNKTFEPFTTYGDLDTINDLTIGHEYILKELKAPEGYEYAPDIHFKVTGLFETEILNTKEAYGYLTKENKRRLGRAAGDMNVNLIMIDPYKKEESTTSITMAKVDENYQFLPGADLTLTDETDSTKPKQTFTSTEDGIVFDQLIIGHTYRLKETKAPEGYDLAEDIVFEVTGPSTVKIISGTNQLPQYYQAGKKFNFFMMDKKKAPETTSQISMMKVDEEQQPLPDAKLTLSDETDTKQPVQEYTSTNEKTFFKDLIIGHTYRLKEIEAPKGYELAEDIVFEVTGPSTVKIISGTELLPSDKETNFFMMDKKKAPETTSQISMMKVDEEQQPLPDAKLTLSDETDTKQPVQEYTSTNEKTFFKDLIIGHTYRLKEIEAPKGYELAEDIVFKVKNSTEVEITSDTKNIAQSFSHPSTNICMVDKKKKVEPVEEQAFINMVKVDDNYRPIAGAKLTLSDELDPKQPVQKYTSTKEGIHFENVFIGHIYRLREVEAPDGYELAKDIVFKITAPFEVKIISGTENIPQSSESFKYNFYMIDKKKEIVDPEPDKPDKPEPPVGPKPDKPGEDKPSIDPNPNPDNPGEDKPPVDSNPNSESDSINHSEGSSSENIDTTPEKPTPLPPVVSPDSSHMESINTEHESSDSMESSQSENFSSQDSTESDSSTTQSKNTHSSTKNKKQTNHKKNQINNKDSDNQKDLPQTSQKEEYLLLWIGIFLTIPFIISIYLFHKKKI